MKLKTLVSLALSTVLFTPADGLLAQSREVPAWQQVRDVPHGVVQRFEYQSKSINNVREAIVYGRTLAEDLQWSKIAIVRVLGP